MTAPARILVVDDDVVSRRLASRVLEQAGYAVEAAPGGAEGVRAASERPPDAILLDLRMPGMDGPAAAREIRRLEGAARRTPIIALTGDHADEDRAEALAAGMDEVVAKPLQKPVLLAALEALLARARAKEGAPAGEAAAAPARLDEEAMGRLRSLAADDPGFLPDLIDTFLRSFPERLAAIRAGVAAQDGGAVARAAHPLKSNLASFGATVAATHAGRLEEVGRAGALAEVPAALAALEAEAAGVRAALLEERGRPSTPSPPSPS